AQLRVLPETGVLGIGNADDRTDSGLVAPHVPGHLRVQPGHAVGPCGQAQGGQSVAEQGAISPGSLPDGLQRQAGEVAHAVQELRVAFLVARLLRGVGSEYYASADLSHITESGQQMEGQGQRMRLVEVVNGRATELFNHLGTADAKNYALGHPGCRFRVIQAVGDGAGEVVVFRNIGGQQIDGGSAEGLRRQTQYPDMYRMTIDADLGAQIRRLQEGAVPPDELHPQARTVLAYLVVVAVFPEAADATPVLLQIVGATHVRAGQKAQPAGVDLQRLIDGVLHREVGHG